MKPKNYFFNKFIPAFQPGERINGLVKKALYVVLFAFFSSVCGAQPAVNAPAEAIKRFEADIAVNTDASAQVVETISFQVTGEQIKRGIIRVLPYSGVSDYQIQSVSLDGRAVPYFTRAKGKELEIVIGDRNQLVSPGVHTYRIAYRAAGVVRFQKKFDELYWNVTGNGWNFPIEAASMRLTLPPGAQAMPGGISLYTGEKGARQADAQARGDSFFYTTRPLKQGEGFTVSVAWNKGVVAAPASVEKKSKPFPFPLFHKSFVWVCWALLLIYYAVVWYWKGKDPRARILRRFEPPEGLSPAQVRYMQQMKCDEDIFSVVIMSLVEKGWVRVRQPNPWSFAMSRVQGGEQGLLSDEEKQLVDILFKEREMISVSNQYQKDFQEGWLAVKQSLAAWENRRFFARNSWANIPTLLFGGLLGWTLLSSIYWGSSRAELLLQIVFWGFWGSLIFGGILKKILPAVFSFTNLFILGAALCVFVAFGFLPTLCTIALLVPGVVFYRLVRAYTPKGREYMDQIEGFLQYLQVAEKYRVFVSNPTDANRIYCHYLPYAAALGLQNKWRSVFQAEIGEAAAERVEEANGFGFCRRFDSLNRALQNAQVAPHEYTSSDSGFGGGGFSGGGSGGGGGRGW